MNAHHSQVPAANFAAYANRAKITFIPKRILDALAVSKKFLEETHAQGARFSEAAANVYLENIQKAAHENPNAENLDRLAQETSEEVHRRYERVRVTVGQSIEAHRAEKLRPLYREIHDRVQPVIQAVIDRAEAEARTRAAEFGVPEAAKDPVAEGMRAFRNHIVAYLMPTGAQTPEPDVVRYLFGEYAATHAAAKAEPTSEPTVKPLRTARQLAAV
jgi:hypothetical protein